MSDSNQKCEGCDCAPATTYDSEGIPLCEVCASLPAVPDVKEEEKTLEEPGDVAANTVQGPTALLLLLSDCARYLGMLSYMESHRGYMRSAQAIDSVIARVMETVKQMSVPEGTKSSTGSEYPQTSFETGGRNAQ